MPSTICSSSAPPSHLADSAAAPPVPERRTRCICQTIKACQRIGDHAVIKLHGQMTFKEIEPERLHIKQAGGNEIAIHERPIRIGFTGIDSGHQRAEQRLHQHGDNDNRSNDGLFAETAAFGCAAPIIQRQPKRGSEDNQASPKCMARRYWLTSTRSVRPLATIYQPIKPCRPPNANRPSKGGNWRRLIFFCTKKTTNGIKNTKPTMRPKEAMPPLPPVNEFELGHAHTKIDQLIFGNLFIFLKLCQPVGLRERRQRPAYRCPFGYRQAAIGQPRQPTDQHHQHDETRDGKQP